MLCGKVVCVGKTRQAKLVAVLVL